MQGMSQWEITLNPCILQCIVNQAKQSLLNVVVEKVSKYSTGVWLSTCICHVQMLLNFPQAQSRPPRQRTSFASSGNRTTKHHAVSYGVCVIT